MPANAINRRVKIESLAARIKEGTYGASKESQTSRKSTRSRHAPLKLLDDTFSIEEMSVKKRVAKRPFPFTPATQDEPQPKKPQPSRQPVAGKPAAVISTTIATRTVEEDLDLKAFRKKLDRRAVQAENPKYHAPWWKSGSKTHADSEYVKKTFKLWEQAPRSRADREQLYLGQQRYSLSQAGWLTEQEAKISRKQAQARLPSAPGPPLAGVPLEERRQFNLDQQAFQLRNGLGPLENLRRPPERLLRPPKKLSRRFSIKRGPWYAERGPGAIVHFKRGPWTVKRLDEEGRDSAKEEDESLDFPWVARPRKAFHEKDHVYGAGESPEDLIWIPRGKEADSDDEDVE